MAARTVGTGRMDAHRRPAHGWGNEPAVEVRDLVKRYPKRQQPAVDRLSFSVGRGEIFGLLGPNGAGKSTTIGILTTRLPATSGEVRLSGVDVLGDPVSARARLAVVAQRPNLDRSLTPRQNLTFHAAYHGVGRAERNARAAQLLEQFGLRAEADVKVDWYSGGMAQRLMIARSLMHEPDVLFLDEPTTGLDPQARLFVWDRVAEMRERGVTIMLTTHDMDEATALCDRVGIVDRGRLLALDTPAVLTRGMSGQSVLELTLAGGAGADDAAADVSSVLSALLTLQGVERVEPVRAGGGGGVRARLYLTGDAADALPAAVGVLAAQRMTLTDVHIGAASLEDVFISLTGRGLR